MPTFTGIVNWWCAVLGIADQTIINSVTAITASLLLLGLVWFASTIVLTIFVSVGRNR